MNTESTQAGPKRTITIAILAMGGEGGGVLADWLVDLAEHNGYYAQTTSVPGVAQRTGATVYYLEMFPEAATPEGKRPVMALGPVPGEVDVVIASELMEAGRALQRGLVTPERTTFVASTHRVYSMTERTAMGDGRVDADKLLAGCRAAARRFVGADFGRLAEQHGSLIGASLYGALAATVVLPFTRAMFEATIERAGVGVQTSLRAFAAGHAAALSGQAAPGSHNAAALDATTAPSVGPRLAALSARIGADFPAPCHATLHAGILRCADYQDVAYAEHYLDRLQPLLQRLGNIRGGAETTRAHGLLDTTARHLALWMCYEDTVRVADLKTRRSRFVRVQSEVRLGGTQQLGIHEFLHPRIEEIADTLPAGFGRWLLATGWARACIAPFTRKGRVVQTSSVRGFVLLYAVAALRAIRRKSLRYQVEHQRIGDWLADIERLATTDIALALEVARLQRLVKGYGDTHARGWGNFAHILRELPRLESVPGGADELRALHAAALADDDGAALRRRLGAAEQAVAPRLSQPGTAPA